MKIFSASQIRAWDAYTIENEPIASVDLMNRAARTFTDWFLQTYPDATRPVVVFAGTGNNGGDGIAVARMLDQAQYAAKVVVCDFGGRHSDDFTAQLDMVSGFSAVKPVFVQSIAELAALSAEIWTGNPVVIDALFGTGLSRPLESIWAQVVDFLNNSGMELVSIDLPSGLFCDGPTPGDAILKAHRTFTFQTPKLAFFLPENAAYLGAWAYGNIGLHPEYEAQTETPFYYSASAAITPMRKVRTKFAHKGTYGHALLVAGSWGKIGASVLAARACLRSGVGLLSVHVPRCGQMVLQNAVPEAMVQADQRAKFWAEMPDVQGIASIGVGPGIGRAPETAAVLKVLLQSVQVPLVLDADALNIVSENGWLHLIPSNTILTPHPKEFERLFGKTVHGFERLDVQRKMAQQHRIYIVLKGAHTSIASPNGDCWFNSTGNPGMATGGSGDVLTGILTGLLAQGYTPQSACLLGVYLHGLAGDLAAESLSQEALIAGDLIDYLGKAWLKLA